MAAFDFDEGSDTLERAFYALAFWECAKGQEREFWWNLYVHRRAKAFGRPVKFKKFR